MQLHTPSRGTPPFTKCRWRRLSPLLSEIPQAGTAIKMEGFCMPRSNTRRCDRATTPRPAISRRFLDRVRQRLESFPNMPRMYIRRSIESCRSAASRLSPRRSHSIDNSRTESGESPESEVGITILREPSTYLVEYVYFLVILAG